MNACKHATGRKMDRKNRQTNQCSHRFVSDIAYVDIHVARFKMKADTYGSIYYPLSTVATGNLLNFVQNITVQNIYVCF